MNRKEILEKAEKDEGMTVAKIKAYQKMVKPQKQVYGKYGTLAREYLEKHNSSKLWALAGDLSKYLHGIDEQAVEMYETMDAKLSSSERFQKTGDFQNDLQLETEKKRLIEEEILAELVYIV